LVIYLPPANTFIVSEKIKGGGTAVCGVNPVCAGKIKGPEKRSISCFIRNDKALKERWDSASRGQDDTPVGRGKEMRIRGGKRKREQVVRGK